MAKYLIKSENTQYFLTTNDEKPGHVIVTANGKETIPHNALLTIMPPLPRHPAPSVVSISGQHLFIALPEHPDDDSKLIWSDKEYKWVVNQTGDGHYEITPATGQDLYWFDKFGTGPVIIVKPGREVQAPQAYFKILPILRD